MKTQIAATVKQAGSSHPDLTYYWELSANPYYSAASSTFIGQVVGLFGLKNIADAADKASDGGYPELSEEYIVKAQPKIIFLADNQAADGGQAPAIVRPRPGWSAIPAVKDHEVVGLNDDIASRWGPRLPQLVERDRAGGRAGLQVIGARGRRLPAARAYGVAAAFLVAATLVSALVGAADLNPVATITALLDRIPFVHLPSSLSPLDRAVLFDIRLPRIVLGLMVGALLSVAGAGYQGVFRNPLVDSGLLGASSGAGLGATLAIVYLGGVGPVSRPGRRLRRIAGRGHDRLPVRRGRRLGHRHPAAGRAWPWACS